jgi:hypothetical protein
MNHPLSCRCGTLKGYISHPEKVSRGVCYCRDCQAFAHFLGEPGSILDELGGTDVVATLTKYVHFTQGVETLACMSLTEHGMLRWYASCCRTPIGNTPRDFKISHVGLIHSCLESAPSTVDSSFGPVRLRLNTHSAKGKPNLMPLSTIASALWFMSSLVRARIDGSYKKTQFFDPNEGTPVVPPEVLTSSEHELLMKSV